MQYPIQSLVPPILAEVLTPAGEVWYVPRAQQHGPFLAQRRYVGAGSYCYTGSADEGMLFVHQERATPVWVPYLNPAAVQAAGLDITAIMAWSAQHPGQIFAHPTYGPLCLQWGDNANGYIVVAHSPDPAAAADAVMFTPHTCWLTGRTYYQLDTRTEEAAFATLVAQAGLLPHEYEIGLEGSWPDWYLLDINLAAQVLATAGREVVVACPHLYYGAWIYSGEAGEIQWLSMGNTAEEALAFYQRLPEVSDLSQASCTAMWGYTMELPSQRPEWSSVSEKQVPAAYAADLWNNRVVPYPNPAPVRQLYSMELALIEAPTMQRLPLLRDFINTSARSRWQLAQALDWSLTKLALIERQPWQMSLIEVRQVAKLLEVEEENLIAALRQEMNAWEMTQRLSRTRPLDKLEAALAATGGV
jgi:hypothetical protein